MQSVKRYIRRVSDPFPTPPGSDIGSLRRDLRMQVPFPSAAAEAFLTLQRVADELTGEAAAVLRDYGVTPTQYNALRILRGAGAEGLPTTEVGQRLIKREPDVPRLLERLALAGLVHRERSTDDRRVTRCSLTDAGHELLLRLDRVVPPLHEAQFAMLSEEERIQLVRLVDRVRERLARPCAEARAAGEPAE